MVEAWERKLGALNQMVGSVEPPPEVWDRIKAAIGDVRRAAGVCDCRRCAAAPPAARAGGRPPVPPTTPARPQPGIDAGGRASPTAALCVARVATGSTAIAASLLAHDRRCSSIGPTCCPTRCGRRSARRSCKVAGAAGAAAGAVRRGAAEGRQLAGLHPHGRCRRPRPSRCAGSRATPEPGKSYELWLVSDKLQRPRSLGVIGGHDFTTRPALAAYRRRHRQQGDLCGDGRAGRRLADRRRDRPDRVHRQADRERAAVPVTPQPEHSVIASGAKHPAPCGAGASLRAMTASSDSA